MTVSGGATDVRREDRDAAGEQALVQRVVQRPGLVFGTAVDVEHYWMRTWA
jgi:hypothetical protein